jgi:hypothetical protein
MTQVKSLEDLPSQLDFDWQDSVSPNPAPAPTRARSLGGELDVVGTPQTSVLPMEVDVDTFEEIAEIAQEAVAVATQQPPAEVPQSFHTMTDVIGDASNM